VDPRAICLFEARSPRWVHVLLKTLAPKVVLLIAKMVKAMGRRI